MWRVIMITFITIDTLITIVGVVTYLLLAIIMLGWGAINDFVTSKEGIDIFIVLNDYF